MTNILCVQYRAAQRSLWFSRSRTSPPLDDVLLLHIDIYLIVDTAQYSSSKMLLPRASLSTSVTAANFAGLTNNENYKSVFLKFKKFNHSPLF